MLILNELHPEYEQVSSLPQGWDEMSPLVEEYTSLPSQRLSLTDIILSIYTSAPSRLIVDGKSLYIHGQLVSRHSKKLSAKIKAKNEFTIIDSVDQDTFVRFIEWAYKGYYTAAEYWIDAESPRLSKFEDSDTCTPEAEPPQEPEPEIQLSRGWNSFPLEKSKEKKEKKAKSKEKYKKSGKKTQMVWGEPALDELTLDETTPDAPAPEEAAPQEPVTEPELEVSDGWGSFGSKKYMKTGKQAMWMWDVPAAVKPATVPTPPEECPPEPQPSVSSKTSLKESFYSRKYETRQHTITIPSPRSNQGPTENYTPVFLSHAHLYVFAGKYDIFPLQTLALENLHMTLEKFTLHPERTGDIFELLRYIYGHQEFTWQGGEMREMLKGYIGFEMDVLMKDRAFRALLKEEGELLDDFVEMVGKRI